MRKSLLSILIFSLLSTGCGLIIPTPREAGDSVIKGATQGILEGILRGL